MVAGVAASFVSQPSDTILVAVSGESVSSSSEPAAATAAINALDTAAMTAGEGVLSSGSSSSSRVDIPAIVREVLREGGLAGFYKGAVPRAIKSAINIALQFFLYDSCKRLAHVGPDDIKVVLAKQPYLRIVILMRRTSRASRLCTYYIVSAQTFNS
eukprot:14977-Heterococcus_DN1.PRE.1